MFIDELKTAERCYYWKDEIGRHCFMNTVMGLRLFCGVPEPVQGIEPGAPHMKKFLDQILGEPLKYPTTEVNPMNLKQITSSTVTVMINGQKRKVVKLGENLPAYNPKWLKTLRRALPDAWWYVRTDKGLLSPLYAICAGGEAVLMPMNIA